MVMSHLTGNNWRRAIKLYGKVVSNLGPYGGREICFYPTPPQMAFPFTGRSHLMEWRSQLLGVPSRAFPWPGAWDEESGAALDWGRSRTWGGRVPRHFLRPKRQAMGTPSNWERPVTGNAIPLNGNAQ